jgi:hypothetical protein
MHGRKRKINLSKGGELILHLGRRKGKHSSGVGRSNSHALCLKNILVKLEIMLRIRLSCS